MNGNLARLLAGQDPAELAKAVVVNPSTVYTWLSGDRLPWRRVLPAISAATGIPLEDLRRARAEDRAARKAASA